jgi:ribosomal subunit interface protein
MRLELTGRHLEIIPAVRRLVERKLVKLERLLNDSALSAQVVLSREKRLYRVEVSLHARDEKFLHGVGESSAWEPAISQAIDKIVQQAHKVKGKWQARKRSALTPPAAVAPAAAPPPRRPRDARVTLRVPRTLRAQVLRPSRQTLRSMSLSEATRELESNSEGVVVFRDTGTAKVSVLFKRSGGELTLIETDV